MSDGIAEVRVWRDKIRANCEALKFQPSWVWEQVDLLLAEIDRRDAILRRLVEHRCFDSCLKPGSTCPWPEARRVVGDE